MTIGVRPGSKTIESKNLFEGNNWTLPTDIGLIDDATDAFALRLTSADWDKEETFVLQLAFNEALINAIAHGNLGVVKKSKDDDLSKLAQTEQKANPTDKKVYVTLEIEKDSIIVKIRDEGKGFKHQDGDVPDPTDTKGLMRTSGRGLLIMGTAFDSVVYNDKGNEVTMTKRKISN